ncbi:MAG: ABC transporter ATP-binding protein [Planctomycetaceae bacterium]
MLSLQSISKSYTRRNTRVDALRSTTLSVAKGEFVALIGPSGSGKTTLLSMLGGMLAPTTGQILLEGRSLYDLPVAERSRLRNEQIGFVFQHFNLVPWLTAAENVALPLCLYGTDTHIQQTRAMELLTRFGLADRAEHKPSELSAGQQQRVALARTLVTDPQLILADEPTGNLDPDSRALVLESLHAIHQEGRTIVLVTHDHAVSATAQRVLRIADGDVRELKAGSATEAA